MKNNQDFNEWSTRPLKEFQLGQRLHIRFTVSAGYYCDCPAEFLGIVRGNVRVKCLDGWEPDWYHAFNLEKKYPGRIAAVRPNKCYLWGRSPGERDSVCWWFKNINDPVK